MNDSFNLEVDLFKFQRKLKLKDHFKEQTNTQREKFCPVSTFDPPNTAISIRTFIKKVQMESNELLGNSKKIFSNLNKQEREAINTLRNDKQLIIRPADKGGAIVLLDLMYYRGELLQQLSDPLVYEKLMGDPTSRFKLKLDTALEQAMIAGWINETCRGFLTTQAPKCPIIYTLPKVHKDPVTPPGRLISARGSLFSNVALYIDSFLQPLCAHMRSYLPDTSALLDILRGCEILPTDTLFVTLDVRNLYTIIPLDEGIAACRKALVEGHMGAPPIEFICSLLQLVLTCNYFRFEQSFYLQKTGTAMGSNVAPSYANLYMDSFECKYIFPNYADNLFLYLRYIDDIFIIWRGSPIGVESFVAGLNDLPTPVKFTLNSDRDVIDFLDVRIFRTSRGIGTTLFRKSTDRNTVLHAHSFHPPAVIRSIPYTQFLRVFRINTDLATALQQANDMRDRFIERGYSMEFLNTELEKAKENALGKGSKTKRTDIQTDRMVFVSDFTPISQDVNR
uniref:Reverse transcriptase domain-containing protein n=1 Tax=Xenopus tropicalis TaxID=8364 RepID=A0A803JTX1_XENTR